MKKQLLFIMMALLPMVVSAFTGEAVIDGIKYKINTNTQSAEVIKNNYSGAIIIPAFVEYEDVVCNVTSIAQSAFSGCNTLTSILIPNSVTTIANMAFENCSSLTSLTIGNGVTSIGKYAFQKCSSLKSVIIPSNVSMIGNYAFAYCRGLTSLVIEDGVTTIGSNAFQYCSSLPSVDIPSSVTKIDFSTFADCTALSAVSIGNGVATIGQSAFNGCSALSSVLIPNSVVSIGNSAFEGCSSLASLTIGNSVTSIGSYAFLKCKSLKMVTIPSNVTIIGKYAFQYCNGLTSLVIEEGVTTIGSNAFEYCSSLTSVEIPNSITSIEFSTFADCTALSTVSLGNGVTTIGQSAFSGCNALTSILIPNSVTNIGNSAFSGCSSLTTLILGRSLTSIGSYAFDKCKNMTNVFCYAEIIPTTNNNSFSSSYIKNATLYAPEGFVDIYKASSPWSGFKDVLPLPKIIYMVGDEVYKEEVVMVTTSVTPVSSPEKEGYTFSGWIGIPEAMPMEDIIVKGYFTINTYNLTYILDGEVYKQYEYTYSSVIEPEPELEKEGYTFSGWGSIPETMPAENVTVTGSFTINKYKLTYQVDGKEYKTYEAEYGSTIIPEPQPEGDYVRFAWVGIPEKMPAHDVTVTADFETGIADVIAKNDIKYIYGPNGKRVNKLQKGVNIVVMKDGTARKIILKSRP